MDFSEGFLTGILILSAALYVEWLLRRHTRKREDTQTVTLRRKSRQGLPVLNSGTIVFRSKVGGLQYESTLTDMKGWALNSSSKKQVGVLYLRGAYVANVNLKGAKLILVERGRFNEKTRSTLLHLP